MHSALDDTAKMFSAALDALSDKLDELTGLNWIERGSICTAVAFGALVGCLAAFALA